MEGCTCKYDGDHDAEDGQYGIDAFPRLSGRGIVVAIVELLLPGDGITVRWWSGIRHIGRLLRWRAILTVLPVGALLRWRGRCAVAPSLLGLAMLAWRSVLPILALITELPVTGLWLLAGWPVLSILAVLPILSVAVCRSVGIVGLRLALLAAPA